MVQEKGKLDCMLKSESVQTATATELQDEWKLSTEGMDEDKLNFTQEKMSCGLS